jgi:two-component system, cell cycle sensor histidine kinase and response regulator CckA
MPEGGTITITADNVRLNKQSKIPLRPGKYIIIEIKDTGAGIPNMYISKIFDPYFSTKSKGHGLNLATTHSLITRHNGYIRVYSYLGSGSTFQIFLPATGQKEDKSKNKHNVVLFGLGRILIMDDQEMVRKALKRTLEKIGYSVEESENGRQTLEKYEKAMKEQNPFKAVILDLTIPSGLGGKETVNELLKIDPEVQAIACSGYASGLSNGEILEEYKKYGFKDVLKKPYSIEDLSNILTRLDI